MRTELGNPPGQLRRRLRRLIAGGLVLVAVGAVLLLHRLSDEQLGGPPHEDLTVGAGIPVTFYLPPGPTDVAGVFPNPAPPGRRPPVVVLAHGFSADRDVMSSLARSLAAAGMAVVSFDFPGHGNSSNGFRSGNLTGTVDQVVAWAAASPYVDPHRIALMGHSMGGSVVLDFATSDARPAAVIVLSSAQRLADGVDIGAQFVDGPRRPPNVLFLFSADDPDFIRADDADLASRLAGQRAALGQTYGSFNGSTAVRAEMMVGLNHDTELWSGRTVSAAVGWLDQAFSITPSRPARLIDPRLSTAGLYMACVLVLLVGLGVGLARFGTSRDADGPEVPGWPSLGRVVLCLVVAGGFQAMTGGLASLFTLSAYGPVVGFLGLAGAGLFALSMLQRRTISRPGDKTHLEGVGRDVALPATLGTIGVYTLLSPVGSVAHNLAPSPVRLVAGVATFVVVTPFFAGFQRLVRHGPPAIATLRSIVGHVLVLASVEVLVVVGGLPGVVGLLLPVLALVFVIVEIIAAGFYYRGGPPIAIGVLEAAVFAWLVSVMAPIG